MPVRLGLWPRAKRIFLWISCAVAIDNAQEKLAIAGTHRQPARCMRYPIQMPPADDGQFTIVTAALDAFDL
jgi:hypothetical protein